MEIGAVKQAFNNEVILMKKHLNQAKIQIIHKLTRKAKTLAEKKAPEKLKEKFKKKAESAVKEVLIIKKLKAKDIAKFIVTHDGELKVYLNTPEVNQDKACARLLLHKSLQDKYKSIRDRFGNSPIEDLLMSRIERRKMKKEAREKQKNKKKAKETHKSVNAAGTWDVEEIENHEKVDVQDESDDVDSENKSISDESVHSADHSALVSDRIDDSESDLEELEDKKINDKSKCDDKIINDKKALKEQKDSSKTSPNVIANTNVAISNGINKSKSFGMLNDLNNEKKIVTKYSNTKKEDIKIKDKNTRKETSKPTSIVNNKLSALYENNNENMTSELDKNPSKKRELNKNKNFNEKILKRKFSKGVDEQPVQEVKVVDPFFITPTGESYMSVVEPRQPDEVKDFHKQGNRKYRRAVMFGHVPTPKQKRDFKPNNRKFNDLSNSNNKFNNDSRKENSHYNNTKLSEKQDSEKVEKLHPSWEAKKRKSGILPFEGKKIVFDDGE